MDSIKAYDEIVEFVACGTNAVGFIKMIKKLVTKGYRLSKNFKIAVLRAMMSA